MEKYYLALGVTYRVAGEIEESFACRLKKQPHKLRSRYGKQHSLVGFASFFRGIKGDKFFLNSIALGFRALHYGLGVL